VTIQNNFDDVVLTEDEQAEGLRVAREKKYNYLKRLEYFEKVKNTPKLQAPTARVLYDGLMATKSKSGGYYQVNDMNRNIIHALCLYFANDPRFEQQFPQYSLSKGICISGNKGTGKTHLMNYFSFNPKQSYSLPTCKEIAEKFRTNWNYEGVGTVEYYAHVKKASHPQPYNQEVLGFCYGDLGTEDDKNNFGNKMNVLEEIFLTRYEANVPFHLTHFTTNLNPKEIETRYGDRFRDRLKETCNWLILDGQSFR